MKVTFRDVGRDKQTWTAIIKTLTFDALMRQIRSRGALMSRDVEFVTDDEIEFRIYAGMHPVGTVTVEE